MRLRKLSDDLSAKFLRAAIPARFLMLPQYREAIKRVDVVIGYNSRAKVFNVFASTWDMADSQPDVMAGTSVIVFEFDQDTDELEMLDSAVELAGRECLYRGDHSEGAEHPVTDLFQFYKQELGER